MSDIAVGFVHGASDERQADTVVPASRVASVEVFDDVRAIASEWARLAATWAATPYQSPAWLIPWCETVGAALAIEPMIVVARDATGAPMALLPFGIRRRGGLAVAVFLGAKDANFNMGLFRRGPVWTRASLHDLLRRAARAGRTRVDLFALRNQPLAWDGFGNPLAALDHQSSPSFAYKASLLRDPEAFFKGRLSRESRKKLRQKTARLQNLGEVAFVRPREAAEVAEVLDALLRQRRERCEALGLECEPASLRAFLERVTAGPAPSVELCGLRSGDRIVATMAGTRRNGRFSGMLTSFAADRDVARASPGELLLAEAMRHACAEGLATFDLGIGEARYKETYCPDVEPLFDSLVAASLGGRLAAAAEALRLKAKRTIKQSAWAWPLVQRLRKLRAALCSSRLPDRPLA